MRYLDRHSKKGKDNPMNKGLGQLLYELYIVEFISPNSALTIWEELPMSTQKKWEEIANEFIAKLLWSMTHE